MSCLMLRELMGYIKRKWVWMYPLIETEILQRVCTILIKTLGLTKLFVTKDMCFHVSKKTPEYKSVSWNLFNIKSRICNMKFLLIFIQVFLVLIFTKKMLEILAFVLPTYMDKCIFLCYIAKLQNYWYLVFEVSSNNVSKKIMINLYTIRCSTVKVVLNQPNK